MIETNQKTSHDAQNSYTQIECTGCHKAITPGQIALQALNSVYHNECFRCNDCDSPIGGHLFKIIESRHVCNRCFERRVLKKVVGICPKCNKEITGAFLGAINNKFHPECFNCTHCQINISKTSFQVKDNQPYCINCYGELFSPNCFICSKKIRPTEPYLQVEQNNVHQTCFVCIKCQVPLTGKPFGVRRNQYFCQPHSLQS